MKNRTLMAALVLTTMVGAVHADEGMWVPQQLPDIASSLKKAGLKLDPRELANLTGDPMGAVVSLGGCTASFVSPQGLVVTNHHCAHGAIQLNSTPQKNLLKEGFYAATPGEEVSAGPNARAYALESIRDVTADMRAAIEAAPDPLARKQAADALEKKLVADCEAGGGYRCRVARFLGGNAYRLFRNLEIRDVRLVYAPPGAIGNYGGEVDNWMWPRHTGDFSFLRAYVGKDGKPAAFSPDNVPYQPKHWLKLADKDLDIGSFVMVAGYPGYTSRYALASEFEDTATWTYPVIGRHFKNMVAMIQAAGEKNPDIAIRYASVLRGQQNVLKNFDGQLEGFRRIGAAEKKRAEEQAVLAWLRGRGNAGKAALEAHAKLEQLQARLRATRERDFVVDQLRRGVLDAATNLYRLSLERTKPDAEREQGYQERDLPAFEGGLQQMDKRYHASMDRQLQAYWLREYVKLPAAQRVAAIDAWLGGSDEDAIQRALDRLAGTKLGSLDARMALFKADRKAFETSEDPAVQFAVAILPTLLELEQQKKAREGEDLVARPVYLQAVADYRESRGGFVYPDANSTLRITFGNVTGYTKVDGSRQAPFTTLEQVAAKATGEEPFDAPKAQLEAIAAKRHGGLVDPDLGTVPVNFLSNLDITGGNSGSPVLDAEGKLVGLAFDMNWEAVASNWVFDPEMTRMISVDQRYMRWIMQEAAPAPRVLQELGVAPAK